MPHGEPLVSVSLKNTFKDRSKNFELFLERGKQCLRILFSKKQENGMGWISYPSSVNSDELERVKEIAHNLALKCETIVVVGIGGSYLGAKSIIASLEPLFQKKRSNYPEILFAGTYLSGEACEQLLQYLKDRSLGLVVVSKSGNTLEPFIAFQLLEKLLCDKYGTEEARKRIVVVTDPVKGYLRHSVSSQGYTSLPIPPAIGGRFSALTPAGILPACLRGIDVKELLRGAVAMEHELLGDSLESNDNPALLYAASRQFLYQHGNKKIELLTSFDPFLSNLGEWWKQLFAESEGKEGKGLFVSNATFTTDLHAMGQWIQQGERTIFETILATASNASELKIPQVECCNAPHQYLSQMSFSHIEKSAERGTIEAHVAGGVPVIQITIPRRSAFYVGALLYFFELAVAISGSLLGINPFDQPGVDAYKTKMYHLLKKD